MQLGYPISTWLNPHMAGHSGQDERRVRWYTGPTAVRCLRLEVIDRRAHLAPSLLEEHSSMNHPGLHLCSLENIRPLLFFSGNSLSVPPRRLPPSPVKKPYITRHHTSLM